MGKKTKKERRIPKRIAGIKVPKELRKSGERLLDLASDPVVNQAISAALVAAAGALASGKGMRSAAKAAGLGGGAAAVKAKEGSGRVGIALGVALAELAAGALGAAAQAPSGEGGRKAGTAGNRTAKPGKVDNPN
jgi:hypothetical protein